MKKLIILVSIFFLTQNIFSLEKTRNYSDTIAFIKTLNSNFMVKELDTVEYKNYKYPIYKISYNPQKENKGKKYLIISGVHGNEPAPVYAIKDFIISLNNKDVKRKDLQIDFILIVNPFGFEFNQRYFDFSKIEAGKIEIISVEYDLSSLINDLVNMIELRQMIKVLRWHLNWTK